MTENNGANVEEVVTPPENKENANPEDKGDSKDKNFAALRTKAEALEKENAELKKKNAELEGGNGGERTLIPEDKPDEKKEPKSKDDDTDALKVVFERDVREATRQFNKKTQVSSDEWNQIRSKVSLTGKETVSEITEKIEEAYENLPSTKKKREQEIFNKGRRHAMTEINDDEMDIGAGGEDSGGEGSHPVRVDSQTRKFARSMGMTDDEINKVGEVHPRRDRVMPEPTRKFFSPGS